MTVRHAAIEIKRSTQQERRRLRILYGTGDHWRPETRGDCASFARPCPYVGCRHHLLLEVTEVGNLKVNFPEVLEDWVLEGPCLPSGAFFTDGASRVVEGPHLELMPATCAIDAAEELSGGHISNEDVGKYLRLSRERIRQELARLHARLGDEAAFAEAFEE